MLLLLTLLCGPVKLPSWLLAALPSQEIIHATAGAAPILATFDGSWDWRLIVELATLVLMLVLAFKPSPPLHQQFADKEEFEKQKREQKEALEKHKTEIWEVVNGLRRSVSRIETSVEGIKTLREANGERLDELNAELMELIKEVSKLNERTEVYMARGGHGHS